MSDTEGVTEGQGTQDDREERLRRHLHKLIDAAALAACGETASMPAIDDKALIEGPMGEELSALSQAVGEMAAALTVLRERAGLPRAGSWRGRQSRPAARFRGGPAAPSGDGPMEPQLALQRVRDELIGRVGLAPAAIILFSSSRKAQVSTAAIDREGYLRLMESLGSEVKLVDSVKRTLGPAADPAQADQSIAQMLGTWRKFLS